MLRPETDCDPLGPSKTITGFCTAEDISRAKYYELKKKGLGPDETRVDGIIRITPESHARWRRRHTKQAAAGVQQTKSET